MKAIRVLSSVALLVALTASIAAAHDTSSRLERRDAGRHERVDQGQRHGRQVRTLHSRRSSQLTWWEAARLRAGQAQIRRMERLAYADAIVTPRERLMIQRAKQQQMRMAFRFRNNGRMA